MSLLSDRVEAFGVLARERSFSKAAKIIGISQPSLSTKIRLLEEELKSSLFHRKGRSEVTLTEAGRLLLRYHHQAQVIGQETLGSLFPKSENLRQLQGALSIAGLSSIIPTCALPALAPTLRDNPSLQATFMVRPSGGLPELLFSYKADFVFLDSRLEKTGVEAIPLGFEELVVIESTQYSSRNNNTYLDTDPDDPATEGFFKIQKTIPKYDRSFVHDNTGLFEGVINGLGRAVVDKRSIPRGAPVRIVPGLKTFRVPVVLHFMKQKYYSEVQKKALVAFKENCPPILRYEDPRPNR